MTRGPTPDAAHAPGRRRFVTIRGARGNETVDLEMPGDRSAGELLPDLIKALNWPASDGDRLLRYQLQTEAGSPLAEGETLVEAGVENSDVLKIVLVEDGAAPPDASPDNHRGALAPPRAAQLVVSEPSLVSRSGLIFVLGRPPITIGRPDRETRPDINLTELETGRDFVSSRRHAGIVVEGGDHTLVARPTTNGTFVNGVEIRPGEKRALKDGDVIQFGFQGVELTFCLSARTALAALSAR